MGRRQKRIVESLPVFITPSPGFHSGSRFSERTVRYPIRSHNHRFFFLTRSLGSGGKKSWFCEPAYDKLRGTEEGIINSRLYNEKAYVLSRGFVRRALEIPLGSLESEISWLYHGHGRLAKVLCDARALVEKSRGEASQEPSSAAGGEHDRELAVPRLTAGGIITLERTLAKLGALQQAPTP
jgi:hypothetical protein